MSKSDEVMQMFYIASPFAEGTAIQAIKDLEAENSELRQSIKAAWLLGRKAWCPAAILDDQERTERDWQQARAALEGKL